MTTKTTDNYKVTTTITKYFYHKLKWHNNIKY